MSAPSAVRGPRALLAGLLGLTALAPGQSEPDTLRSRATAAFATRAAEFANVQATLEWRDDHRNWTNRCEMHFLAPARLALDFGHDSAQGDWNFDWNRRRFYVLGTQYSSVEIGDRLYGEKLLANADALPATIMICPWFILTGWWPDCIFGRDGGRWRGRAIDIRELLEDQSYQVSELANGYVQLLSNDGLDQTVLDPAHGFSLVSRRISGSEAPSEASLSIDSWSQLAGGTWVPREFRFSANADGRKPALRGQVTVSRLGVVTPKDFSRPELDRAGTACVNEFGAFDRQVVPGGHDLLDAFAAHTRDSPLGSCPTRWFGIDVPGPPALTRALGAGVVGATVAGVAIFLLFRPRSPAVRRSA